MKITYTHKDFKDSRGSRVMASLLLVPCCLVMDHPTIISFSCSTLATNVFQCEPQKTLNTWNISGIVMWPQKKKLGKEKLNWKQ